MEERILLRMYMQDVRQVPRMRANLRKHHHISSTFQPCRKVLYTQASGTAYHSYIIMNSREEGEEILTKNTLLMHQDDNIDAYLVSEQLIVSADAPHATNYPQPKSLPFLQ